MKVKTQFQLKTKVTWTKFFNIRYREIPLKTYNTCVRFSYARVSICSSDTEDELYGNNDNKEFCKMTNFTTSREILHNLFLSDCIYCITD